MKKLRIGAMAITVAVAVGAFLGAQRLALIPGPWTNKPLPQSYNGANAAALDAYSAAIAENPGDYMAYYRRGTVFIKQRHYDQALTDLDAAVRLSPTPLSLKALGARVNDTTVPETHTFNLVVLVRTTRAETLRQMNRPEEALADFDEVLALDARRTLVLYDRGMLRMMMGRYDDAIADFDTLLNGLVDPQWYFARGVAEYLKADWAGAISDFQKAEKRAPSDTYLIWLAKAHLRASLPLPRQEFSNMEPQSNARHVIEAFLSDYNADQFVSGVRAGAGYVGQGKRSYQCETALFLSDWLLIRKKGIGARNMLSEAETTCPPLSIEKAVADAELKRLRQ